MSKITIIARTGFREHRRYDTPMSPANLDELKAELSLSPNTQTIAPQELGDACRRYMARKGHSSPADDWLDQMVPFLSDVSQREHFAKTTELVFA